MAEVSTHIEVLAPDDCAPALFENFDRYQEVHRCWRKQDGHWVLRDIPYIENWDDKKKKQIIEFLAHSIRGGGCALGVYHQSKLIGFASYRAKFFGSENQYVNLDMMHISYGFRGQGIGKRLFIEICDYARQSGVKKLYISAHSAEDTIAFYRKIGCIDAREINRSLQESEPFDCQLEYDLLVPE